MMSIIMIKSFLNQLLIRGGRTTACPAPEYPELSFIGFRMLCGHTLKKIKTDKTTEAVVQIYIKPPVPSNSKRSYYV